MRITRRQLKKLIREAFIADAEGRVRRVGKGWISGERDSSYEHPHADKIMSKATSGLDQETADKLSTLYHGSEDRSRYVEDEMHDKKQSIELATQLAGMESKDADDAHFDIDVALDPRFEDFKYEADLRPYDLGLLKSFLDFLHKKGELLQTDGRKPYWNVYDIGVKFVERYPGQEMPDEFDYEKLGVHVYGGDLLVVGYDPEKFSP